MRRAQRGDAKQLRVGGGDRLERDLAAAHHLLELRRIELQRHVRAEERHDATARIDDLNDGPKGPQQPPDRLGRQRLDGARRSLFVNLGADTLRGMQQCRVELVEDDATNRPVEHDDRETERDGENDRVPGREARPVSEAYHSIAGPR